MTPEEKKVFEQMREALEGVKSRCKRGYIGMDGQYIKVVDAALSAVNAVSDQPTNQDLIHTCSPQVAWPQWQPIDTAPRDGEWVITYDGKDVVPNYYLGSGIEHWAKTPLKTKPTHWVPLPPAPEAA